MTMAQDGERRMLFDIRGRRKHVVRVVYAILALLMGASLFLVVGPFNIANVINTGSSTDAAEISQEQAEKIEAKLRREPENAQLLAALTRRRIAAGNVLTETNSATGFVALLPEGRVELERAGAAWERYLKEESSPTPSVATQMSRAYFFLAENAPSLREAEAYVKKAAETQDVAAKGKPTINSLTTLAIYEYYAGDFAAGDKAAKRAEAAAPSKAQVKEVKKQMAENRTQAKGFAKQLQEVAKAEKEQGKEALKNPFGELGGASLGE
jgi:hypothetical protein